MASIIKVDTIQDQDGNNIISESANTITIGASGDTITIPSGATLANSGIVTGFESTGIDDNATSTAITIDSSQNVDVAGTIIADGAQIDGIVTINGTGRISSDGSIVYTIDSDNTSTDAGHYFRSDAGINRFNVLENGDISFYEDTGTTPKMFWDASAEALGIGTSSPAFTLEVNKGSAGDIARFTDGVNANTVIKTSGSVTTFGPDTNNSLAFQTNNTERMRIDSSGNVGIGTTVSAQNTNLLTENGFEQLGNKILHFNKYLTGNVTAATILTIQVPVASVAYYIEATYISSRAPNTNSAASKVSKESYFIARNGSGYDVVLNSNLNSADYEVTTTTAGGSLVPASINAQIARGGSEANTDTQSVVIKANIGFTNNSNGGLIASFKLIMLGTIPDIT